MGRLFVVAACIAPTMALGQTLLKLDLARDDGHGKPGHIVRTFSASDDPLHFVLTFKPLTTQTAFTGTLTAVEAGSIKNRQVATTHLTGIVRAKTIDFRFNLHRNWPAGRYKVEVKADGKKLREVAFTIK